MPIRLAVWFEILRSRLWLVPALFVLGAAVAAVVTVTIDRTLGPDATGPFVFGGGPESARSLLSTIAAAMLCPLASAIRKPRCSVSGRATS